jgi:hypothetical protein
MTHSPNESTPRLLDYLRAALAADDRAAGAPAPAGAPFPGAGGDGARAREAETARRPVEAGGPQRVGGARLAATAPLISHSTIARIARPTPVSTATLALAKPRAAWLHPIHKRRLFASTLPTLVTPTVASGDREDPVPVGDYLLWPDPAAGRAYFVGVRPTFQEVDVSVRRDPSYRTTGGTASIAVSVFPAADRAAVLRLHEDWAQALTAAGHGRRRWRFDPLQIGQLRGALDLPADYVAAPPRGTPNPHQGTVLYLVELTAVGARAWADALSSGASLLGVCRLTYTFSAEGASGRLAARRHTASASIQSLARRVGPESLRVVNPAVEVDATLLVDGHPTIEAVALEMRASTGATETQVFGGEGGTVVLRLASTTPDTEHVEWSVRVSFASASWPSVRASGTLSSDTGWADLINPTSWIRQTTITAMLLDAAGNVLPQTADAGGDADNRVTGSMDFSAAFLDGDTVLQTSFETSSRQVTTVLVPDPPGEAAGTLKLTAFAVRDGRDAFVVRDLSPDERWVLIKVYPNARIEIATNRTPTSETARDRPVTTALETLGPAPPRTAAMPSVEAPRTWGRGDAPPRFSVDLPGRTPYWALEVASDAALFDRRNAAGRDASTYWGVRGEGPLWLRRGTTAELPRAVWDALRGAEALYYRIWTSRSRTRWDRPETSLPDAMAPDAPSIRLAGPGAARPFSPEGAPAGEAAPSPVPSATGPRPPA